mgnify:CR=1 FL=1
MGKYRSGRRLAAAPLQHRHDRARSCSAPGQIEASERACLSSVPVHLAASAVRAISDTVASHMPLSMTTYLVMPPCSCCLHVLQVYMSALTSSITALEQQVTLVNGTTATLATKLSAAYGDNAVQRDSQLDVQVTTLYHVSAAAFKQNPFQRI